MKKKQLSFLILKPLVPLFLLLFVLYALGDTRWSLILSAVAAYLSFPLVKFLEEKGIRRELGALMILVFVITPIVLLMLSLIPVFIQTTANFLRNLPNDMVVALQRINQNTEELGFSLPVDEAEIRDFVRHSVEAVSMDLLRTASSFAKTSFLGITSVILWILQLVFIPVFFFFVLSDFERWKGSVLAVIPPQYKPVFFRLGQLADKTFSAYLRGQLMACLILATLYGLSLHFLGLRLGWLIGMMTGLFVFLPYVGFSIGFITMLVVALSTGLPLPSIIMIIGAMICITILEGFYITPKFVGGSVGLSPLEAIIGIMVCGSLFGFLGILLALPTTAFVKQVVGLIKEERL